MPINEQRPGWKDRKPRRSLYDPPDEYDKVTSKEKPKKKVGPGIGALLKGDPKKKGNTTDPTDPEVPDDEDIELEDPDGPGDDPEGTSDKPSPVPVPPEKRAKVPQEPRKDPKKTPTPAGSQAKKKQSKGDEQESEEIKTVTKKISELTLKQKVLALAFLMNEAEFDNIAMASISIVPAIITDKFAKKVNSITATKMQKKSTGLDPSFRIMPGPIVYEPLVPAGKKSRANNLNVACKALEQPELFASELVLVDEKYKRVGPLAWVQAVEGEMEKSIGFNQKTNRQRSAAMKRLAAESPCKPGIGFGGNSIFSKYNTIMYYLLNVPKMHGLLRNFQQGGGLGSVGAREMLEVLNRDAQGSMPLLSFIGFNRSFEEGGEIQTSNTIYTLLAESILNDKSLLDRSKKYYSESSPNSSISENWSMAADWFREANEKTSVADADVELPTGIPGLDFTNSKSGVAKPSGAKGTATITRESNYMSKDDIKKLIKEAFTDRVYGQYPYSHQSGDEQEPKEDYAEEWKKFCLSIVQDKTKEQAINLAKILIKDLELFEDVLDLAGQNQSIGSEILKKMQKNMV